tara:strand:+ start:9896 stop:10723 length:828 start_codon:yes stop_codon:yes gene_type:complete
MKINENFKNIADGATAFCIFGGPSASNYDKQELKKLIQNNFSICVNKGIEHFSDAAMWLTADNKFRQYFEDYKFVLLDPRNAGNRVLYQSKNNHIENYKGIKVVFGQEKDNGYDIGQIPIKLVEYYSSLYDNVFYCKEYKDPNKIPDWMPALSLEWDQCLEKYGTDMQSIHAGGNIASNIFQLLYYMGFEKIVVLGYCDRGTSIGYSFKSWQPDYWEIEGWKVHNQVWGKNLKFLSGGEMYEESTGTKHLADITELNNLKQRKSIMEKIYEVAKD